MIKLSKLSKPFVIFWSMLQHCGMLGMAHLRSNCYLRRC